MQSADWSRAPLLECYDVFGGISKKKSFFGRGIPLLDFKTVLENHFVPENFHMRVQATDEELLKYNICYGDIFLNRTSESADALACCCVANRDFSNAVYTGFVKRLRPKQPHTIYPAYIAGYLRSSLFRRQVKQVSTSYTTRASLDNYKLSKLFIYYPSWERQKAIGDMLFLLFEKMQNNQKLAQLLLQQLAGRKLEPSIPLSILQEEEASKASSGRPSLPEPLLELFEHKRDLLQQQDALLESLRTTWIEQNIVLPVRQAFPRFA